MKKTTLLTWSAFALVLSLSLVGCQKKEGSAPAQTTAPVTSEAELPQEDSLRTQYPVTVTVLDAEGTPVEMTFASAPERVISTQLSMTELLFELGLDNRIVSVFDNDNALTGPWAESIGALPSLGDKKSVSKESILALSPDLIIGKGPLMFTETSIGTVEEYQSLGISVYTQLASASMKQSFDNVLQDIRNIGIIFDVQERANAYADTLKQKLDQIVQKVSDKQGEAPVRVLFMASYKDRTFSAFSSAFSTCMLQTVNAKSVVEKGAGGLTLENLIELQPDVIFYVKSTRAAATDATAVSDLLSEDAVQSVPAISNQKIVEVNYDDVMDYGARTIDALETLYHALYAN